MQTISETPVFQKTYDLYKALHEIVKKYPKGDRYSLGEKTQQKVLDLLEAITKAGHAKKEWKAAILDQAIAASDLVKVFIRLGYDTTCLNQKQYIALEERLQEIGRMLGGWKRSV